MDPSFTNLFLWQPEEIKIPADVPSCKRNLFSWLSEIIDDMNTNPARIIHCWETT